MGRGLAISDIFSCALGAIGIGGSPFDMSGNVASANNFIRAGYRMYQPQYPWGFPSTLYWRKTIHPLPSVHSTHSKRL
jgi:hypothetical protein